MSACAINLKRQCYYKATIAPTPKPSRNGDMCSVYCPV
uniref:Uncharacterized protein n=1 Tax=Arundo donax TaxID=35708 RepID=A0A0A9GT14_ARUDO